MWDFQNSVTLLGVGKKATMSDRTFECMAIPARQNGNKTRGASGVIPDKAMMLQEREGKDEAAKVLRHKSQQGPLTPS